MAEYSTYGRHIAVDAWGVEYHLLNNEEDLRDTLVQAAMNCGATVLNVQHWKFSPNGVTVLVMLSESHVSIHTYPEKGFAAIDCYTCGVSVDPQTIMSVIIGAINPQMTFAKKFIRGVYSDISEYQ